MGLATDPFKGQGNLSRRNDFNEQSPEIARIATLSQQTALMLKWGPNKLAGVRNNPPPHHASTGREGCGATSQLKTKSHY